jgi:hypothetical protein
MLGAPMRYSRGRQGAWPGRATPGTRKPVMRTSAGRVRPRPRHRAERAVAHRRPRVDCSSIEESIARADATVRRTRAHLDKVT